MRAAATNTTAGQSVAKITRMTVIHSCIVALMAGLAAIRMAARITGRAARPTVAPATETAATESVARNLALFFAAPFIGLAYIIAAPFVGVYAIARCGMRMALGR